jgi:hypothetical protein
MQAVLEKRSWSWFRRSRSNCNNPRWEPSPPVKRSAAVSAANVASWRDELARPLLPAGRGGSVLAPAMGNGLMRAGRMLSWLLPGSGRVLSPMEFHQP